MNREALIHDQKVSPLICATSSENIDAINLLLIHGADVNKVGSMGINALHAAVLGSSQDVLGCLLENNKVNVNVPTVDPSLTPLHIAVMTNKEQAAQQLIGSGRVDINKPNIHGQTPVVFSILTGNKAILSTLLEKGANLTSKDVCGRTPLAFALLMGDDKITKKIVSEMKVTDIHNDLDLYRSLAKLDENAAIEEFILNYANVTEIGGKRKLISVELVDDCVRAATKLRETQSRILTSHSAKLHAGAAETDSGTQTAPTRPVEISEAGPSSRPITSSVATQTLPLEIVERETFEQAFSRIINLETNVHDLNQNQDDRLDAQDHEINQLKAELQEHKRMTRQTFNEIGKRIDGALTNIRAVDAKVNSLEKRTKKIERALHSYFGDIPQNLASDQREYFRSFLFILNQRFLVASAIDSGQISVSSNAVSNIDATSIGMSIAGNAASLANAASDVAGGLAIAGSIAGGVKALVNHWVTNYATNHSESISHFFSTPQRLTLFSFDLAESLIPQISKEIKDANNAQEARDNQQSNPLTKGLNIFRKAARRFHCTAGSLQEVTSNKAIFTLADKHINTLSAEIHNLRSRDKNEFLRLAYQISEGDYSNAITWSKTTVI